jgi:hypothetical protein
LVRVPGSKFWPGHRVLVESVLVFLNQNDVILVKKKKKNKSQQVCNRVLTGSCWVNRVARSAGSHRVFPSPVFSSTRPGSSLGSAGSRVGPPGRAGFQNYAFTRRVSSSFFPFFCFSCIFRFDIWLAFHNSLDIFFSIKKCIYRLFQHVFYLKNNSKWKSKYLYIHAIK